MDTLRALTVKEFCQQYGIGQTQFYEEVKEGRLPVRKVGRKSLITRDDAESWLQSLPRLEMQAA
ncbi:helix-turn-helix domain-containing protein [Bradyrhizobium yuanmingense]|uniref:helix-turn-helix domain-containing protein n=1 Tax=Bradyrhizobium yuanmingense TaxID=108015 RepID=UPI0023B9152D|nr:helix-turn-helix domain-containing protein [Bradyrhizobium yuanmingense]MDF0495384.1 helix-turn-helix domain-containing protein [Bradyrhizobium yuanmingense]